MSTNKVACLFCDFTATSATPNGFTNMTFLYDCPNCGKYRVDTLNRMHLTEGLLNEVKKAIISHAVYKMQKPNEYPLIDFEKVEQILNNNNLPSPFEQADNIILWLGNITQYHYGKGYELKFPPLAAIGTLNFDTFKFVREYLHKKGLIETPSTTSQFLTFSGWQKYEELTRIQTDSRKAFMAMPFRDRYLKTSSLHLKRQYQRLGSPCFI